MIGGVTGRVFNVLPSANFFLFRRVGSEAKRCPSGHAADL
jgi:hypothetical protein